MPGSVQPHRVRAPGDARLLSSSSTCRAVLCSMDAASIACTSSCAQCTRPRTCCEALPFYGARSVRRSNATDERNYGRRSCESNIGARSLRRQAPGVFFTEYDTGRLEPPPEWKVQQPTLKTASWWAAARRCIRRRGRCREQIVNFRDPFMQPVPTGALFWRFSTLNCYSVFDPSLRSAA